MEEFRTKLPLIVGKKENLVVGKVEEKVPFSPPEFRIRIQIYLNPYHMGGGQVEPYDAKFNYKCPCFHHNNTDK